MRLSKIKIFIYLPTTPTNYLSTIPDSMVQRSPPFGNLFSDYLKLGSREIVYFGGIGVVGKISAVLTVTFFSIKISNQTILENQPWNPEKFFSRDLFCRISG